MDTFLTSIGIVAFSQIIAPFMVMDFPSFHKVKVNSTKVYPEGFYDSYACFAVDPPEQFPKRLEIEGKTGVSDFNITVWLEEYRVLRRNDKDFVQLKHSIGYLNPELYARSSGGSGDIGIIIFGIPALLVTLPLWGSIQLGWKLLKYITGMDQHKFALWCKLKNQIEEPYRSILKEALIKESQF